MTSPASAIEAIEKAMEGVTPDILRYEADAMYAAIQGEECGDTHHAYNWSDKPHRVLYDAINMMRRSADTIDALARQAEALQRENAELRKMVTDCSAALSPFADAVFNDNGDMAVNLSLASGDDFIRAYFADRRARALLGGENAGN